MKMAPTAEIEVLLGLPLLHVMIIVKNHAGTYRPMCSCSRNLNTKIQAMPVDLATMGKNHLTDGTKRDDTEICMPQAIHCKGP
jgi:hypothetical protein